MLGSQYLPAPAVKYQDSIGIKLSRLPVNVRADSRLNSVSYQAVIAPGYDSKTALTAEKSRLFLHRIVLTAGMGRRALLFSMSVPKKSTTAYRRQ